MKCDKSSTMIFETLYKTKTAQSPRKSSSDPRIGPLYKNCGSISIGSLRGRAPASTRCITLTTGRVLQALCRHRVTISRTKTELTETVRNHFLAMMKRIVAEVVRSTKRE